MALRVSIPGVGVVSVEGAAQESTLQQLVGLTQRSIQSRTRLDSEVSNLIKRQSSSAAEAAGSMSQLAGDTRRASSASANYYSQLNEYVSMTSSSFDGLGGRVASFAEQLATAPLTIIGSWTKNFSGAGFGDPIVEAASTLSAGINLATSAVSTFSMALGSVVKGIGLEKLGGAVSGLGEKAADLVGTVATGVNNRMAAELTSSVKNLATFNSMGASFSKGVGELRDISSISGMTLDQFTRVVKSSREDIKGFGANVRDGALDLALYADYMNKATTDGTKDGRSYRNEMRMLGYTVEEQVELTAQYLAQQRQSLSAEQFANLTRKQVADGTRKYAEDLKVLSDITGKNAKAAMDEANKKSMEADIMAQLKPEEAEKFRKAYAAMPDYAKKGFLEYVSSGGTAIVDQATNIAMSQNKEVERLIKEGYSGIKDQNKTASQVQDETLKRASAAGEAQRKINREQGNAIAMANRFTGQLGDAARIQNEITASAVYDPEAVDRTRQASIDQAKTTDELSKGIMRANETAQDFAVFNQNLASKYLPAYASLIAETTQKVKEYSTAVLGSITGIKSAQEELKRIVKRDLGAAAGAVGMPQGDFNALITTLGEVATVTKDTMKAVKDLIGMITPRAFGGLIKSPELSLLGEKGLPEAVIPLQNGKIPIEFGNIGDMFKNQIAEMSNRAASPDIKVTMETPMAAMKTPIDDNISILTQQLQMGLADSIASANKTKTQQQKQDNEDELGLPESIKDAITTAFNDQNGIISILTSVKDQIANDNSMNQTIFQQQVEKLDTLISTMQDSIRASENIANQLS